MNARLLLWFSMLGATSTLACSGTPAEQTTPEDAGVCWYEVGRVRLSGGSDDTLLHGSCVERQPPRLGVSSDDPSRGQVQCRVLEVGTEAACDCAARGQARHAVDAATLPADIGAAGTCVCELEQLSGDALHSCQSAGRDADVDGWCYVSPAQGLGASDLVTACPPDRQQALIFAGAGTPVDQTTIFELCSSPTDASPCSTAGTVL